MSLRQRLSCVLSTILAEPSSVALLGFPNYDNCGDSAIWIGERTYLARHKIDVAYVSDEHSFSERALRQRLAGGTILLTGGGSLGDIWPQHQLLRERVIAGFRGSKIVQLPQTIHFQTRRNLEHAKSVFDAHPDLTLLVRDERSLELARAHFQATSLLCPDMAFALENLERRPPQYDVIWLARTDAEAIGFDDLAATFRVNRFDWPATSLSGRQYSLLRRLSHRAGTAIHRHPGRYDALQPAVNWMYERLARERLETACHAVSRGRVVITDRLHGHILCLILGIPHVVLDNTYGKLSSFRETWTRGSSLAHWASTPSQAIELADSLVCERT